MAKRVGLAVFGDLIALPFRAFGKQNQRIAARVVFLVFENQIEQLVEIDLIFRDAAAHGAGIGGVERRISGIAAEDAEDADALVRGDRGALALDGVAGARDRGRKADAVFGVANVVVHRLRNGDDFDALPVEMRGIAERVVAADRDQVVELQLLDIFQHLRRHVVDGGSDSAFGILRRRKARAGQKRRGFLHLERIRAGTVQPGAARAVDGACVLAVQRENVAADAGGIVEIDVRETFPAAPDAGDLPADLGAAVHHRLDYGIQTGDIAAARSVSRSSLPSFKTSPCAQVNYSL